MILLSVALSEPGVSSQGLTEGQKEYIMYSMYTGIDLLIQCHIIGTYVGYICLKQIYQNICIWN